jgi:hypothetical protein
LVIPSSIRFYQYYVSEKEEFDSLTDIGKSLLDSLSFDAAICTVRAGGLARPSRMHGGLLRERDPRENLI